MELEELHLHSYNPAGPAGASLRPPTIPSSVIAKCLVSVTGRLTGKERRGACPDAAAPLPAESCSNSNKQVIIVDFTCSLQVDGSEVVRENVCELTYKKNEKRRWNSGCSPGGI